VSGDAGSDGGSGVPSACVVSLGALSVGAGGTVEGNVSAAAITLGAGTEITGNAYASGGVALGSQTTITGTLSYAGALNEGAADSIGLAQHTNVSPPSIPTETSASGTTVVNVSAGGSRTIAPGSYGQVTIGSGARVAFDAGTFTLSSLTVGAGAVVTFKTAGGEVLLRVAGAVVWGSGTVDAQDPSKVGLYSNGASVSFAGGLTFAGSVTAPDGQ
jgi:hypothetical protein